jgi:hypothetical protein
VGPYEPLPALLHRGDLRKVLLVVVVGVVALAALRSGGGGKTPAAPGSCQRPAFAIGDHEVRAGRLVTWSASGPTGERAVLTADSATADRGRIAGPVELQDCAASGRFLVQLGEGKHVVRGFLLRPDGTNRPIGSRQLVVDGS